MQRTLGINIQLIGLLQTNEHTFQIDTQDTLELIFYM